MSANSGTSGDATGAVTFAGATGGATYITRAMRGGAGGAGGAGFLLGAASCLATSRAASLS